tara:strand:+ start:623 stop:952 length:330 start_codon:yes stop_codon:yes gene_type:complete
MSWNKKQIKYIRHTAVRSLFPTGQFEISAEGVVRFIDGNSVTEEQIVAEEQRILKEWNDTEYQRNRQYPDLGEQFDMLWHAIDSGALDKTSKFYTDLKAIKDANPKPSE